MKAGEALVLRHTTYRSLVGSRVRGGMLPLLELLKRCLWFRRTSAFRTDVPQSVVDAHE